MNNFKQLPYWLRGGIIAVGLGSFLWIFLIVAMYGLHEKKKDIYKEYEPKQMIAVYPNDPLDKLNVAGNFLALIYSTIEAPAAIPILILAAIFDLGLCSTIYDLSCHYTTLGRTVEIILLILIYFVLGTVAGWIVGKIKCKHEYT